jgi:hypothetical protein
MTLFERVNARWVREQADRLPHRYRQVAVDNHEKARLEARLALLADGMVEHIADTKCFAVANTRLLDYVERVLKTVGGECSAPPIVGGVTHR